MRLIFFSECKCLKCHTKFTVGINVSVLRYGISANYTQYAHNSRLAFSMTFLKGVTFILIYTHYRKLANYAIKASQVHVIAPKFVPLWPDICKTDKSSTRTFLSYFGSRTDLQTVEFNDACPVLAMFTLTGFTIVVITGLLFCFKNVRAGKLVYHISIFFCYRRK